VVSDNRGTQVAARKPSPDWGHVERAHVGWHHTSRWHASRRAKPQGEFAPHTFALGQLSGSGFLFFEVWEWE
jgi:hypothetical protein